MNKFAAIEDTTSALSGGLLVDRQLIESQIRKACHYVEHVALAQRDGKNIVALIFPNKKFLSNPDYEKSPEEGCFCPRNLNELGRCLSGCFHTMNLIIEPGYAKLSSAAIVNSELSVEDGTLTSSGKINEHNVIEKYVNHLRNLCGEKIPVKEDVYFKTDQLTAWIEILFQSTGILGSHE